MKSFHLFHLRLLLACLAIFGAMLSLPSLARTEPPRGTERLPACSWDRPGHNPFMGDVVAAVDRYGDIPADVRGRLKQRMAARQYDDLVSIRRDSIAGKHRYGAGISDMHFGTARVCGTVSRTAWTPQMEERGLVYCESGHCILVPTVCRNVSRIARAPEGVAPATANAAAPDELLFEPPAAGAPTATDGDSVALGAGGGAPSVADSDNGSGPGGLVRGTPGFVGGPIGGGDGSFLSGTRPPGTAGNPGLPGTVATDEGGPGRPRTPGLPNEPTAYVPFYPPFTGIGGGSGGGGGDLGGGGNPGGPGRPPIAAVPEPGTWALMLAGLAGLAWLRQRRSGAPNSSTQKRS